MHLNDEHVNFWAKSLKQRVHPYLQSLRDFRLRPLWAPLLPEGDDASTPWDAHIGSMGDRGGLSHGRSVGSGADPPIARAADGDWSRTRAAVLQSEKSQRKKNKSDLGGVSRLFLQRRSDSAQNPPNLKRWLSASSDGGFDGPYLSVCTGCVLTCKDIQPPSLRPIAIGSFSRHLARGSRSKLPSFHAQLAQEPIRREPASGFGSRIHDIVMNLQGVSIYSHLAVIRGVHESPNSWGSCDIKFRRPCLFSPAETSVTKVPRRVSSRLWCSEVTTWWRS